MHVNTKSLCLDLGCVNCWPEHVCTCGTICTCFSFSLTITNVQIQSAKISKYIVMWVNCLEIGYMNQFITLFCPRKKKNFFLRVLNRSTYAFGLLMAYTVIKSLIRSVSILVVRPVFCIEIPQAHIYNQRAFSFFPQVERGREKWDQKAWHWGKHIKQLFPSSLKNVMWDFWN
jgi:hypothetical protein